MATCKTIRAVLVILAFLVESAAFEFCFWLFGEREKTKHKMRANKISRYSRAMLRTLGVEFHPPLRIDLQPGLIVCNHLSYVDVLVLSATAPSLFVTSVEVKNQSYLGAICKMAGCLFVERRSRGGLPQEVRAIDLVLALGTSVVVFPEATSSSGEDVLPFKAALYQAAIDAQVAVHHFCIRYEQPEIAYYGDMTFASHFKQLLALPRIPVSLRYVGTFNETQPATRYEIAQKSHRLIQHAYHSY